MDREVGVDAPEECVKLWAWAALSLIAFFLVAFDMEKMWYKLFIYKIALSRCKWFLDLQRIGAHVTYTATVHK